MTRIQFVITESRRQYMQPNIFFLRQNCDHSNSFSNDRFCELFLFMCVPSFDGIGFVPVDGTADVGESVGAVHTINPVVWPIIPHYCNMLATRDLLLNVYSQHEPNPTNNPDRKSIIHHKRGVISHKQASKSSRVTTETF